MDNSFLSRYHYTKYKNFLKRRYLIRHWIPMFIGTPCIKTEQCRLESFWIRTGPTPSTDLRRTDTLHQPTGAWPYPIHDSVSTLMAHPDFFTVPDQSSIIGLFDLPNFFSLVWENRQWKQTMKTDNENSLWKQAMKTGNENR